MSAAEDSAAPTPAPAPTVIQWVLDTRPLWPSAAQTRDLPGVASRALDLLSEEEREAVLKYYHVRDAKLALGSKLLKRHVISRFCGVAWDDAVSTRDERSKPVFRMPDDGSQPVVFNVSHQAGLVVLLAVHHPPPGVAVGVDVVCPSERRARDHEMIRKEGWTRFVDMHADVFAPGEAAALRRLPSTADTDRMLRRFYALWCLREAYVKMTGEALLASWLSELEMVGFAPPEEMTGPYEARFRGQRVDDVDIRLTNELDEYMLSTVVRKGEAGQVVGLGEFERLDINDVLAFGERARS